MMVLGSFRGPLVRGSWARPHLCRWPVEAASVQRAGAVHVDLVDILQALPVHGNHLIP